MPRRRRRLWARSSAGCCLQRSWRQRRYRPALPPRPAPRGRTRGRPATRSPWRGGSVFAAWSSAAVLGVGECRAVVKPAEEQGRVHVALGLPFLGNGGHSFPSLIAVLRQAASPRAGWDCCTARPGSIDPASIDHDVTAARYVTVGFGLGFGLGLGLGRRLIAFSRRSGTAACYAEQCRAADCLGRLGGASAGGVAPGRWQGQPGTSSRHSTPPRTGKHGNVNTNVNTPKQTGIQTNIPPDTGHGVRRQAYCAPNPAPIPAAQPRLGRKKSILACLRPAHDVPARGKVRC